MLGVLIATVSSQLGVFVLTKRVVFIGVTLSQVSALGVAIALLMKWNPQLCAIGLSVPIALLLAFPFETTRIPRDTILGIIFIAASAFSILVMAQSAHGLQQVKVILYGNLLFASKQDFWVSLSLLLPVLVFFLLGLRPTLFTFLDRDAAQVTGVHTAAWELAFFLVLALVISVSTKVTGALLTFCYLVIGPAVGLLFGNRFPTTLLISSFFGVAITLAGMALSYIKNLPTSHTIAGIAASMLVILLLLKFLYRLLRTHTLSNPLKD